MGQPKFDAFNFYLDNRRTVPSKEESNNFNEKINSKKAPKVNTYETTHVA